MNKQLLTKAAKQGIISDKQIVPLLHFFEKEQVQANSDNTSADNSFSRSADNKGEQLKFIRSFGDIFIALGVLLLAFTSYQLAEASSHQIMIIAGFILIAEWLVGHKRLVLPGIVILLSILYFTSGIVDTLIDGRVDLMGKSLDSLTVILTSVMFYLRYKMPFSLYPVAVGSIYLTIELSGVSVIEYPSVFIILGLAVFVIAMWYDSRDTQRISSLSDNGFWLHLLAAPLIVHGVMVTLFLSPNVGLQSDSFYILLLFTLFFFIALFVDRRAILVSSFAYALYAVFKFAYQQFMQVDNLTLFIFMGVGLFVIFFGTYWYKFRAWVFAPISSFRVCKLVPPFEYK